MQYVEVAFDRYFKVECTVFSSSYCIIWGVVVIMHGYFVEQLNKIDDDMKKLLMDKLNILRAMQGGVGGHRSTDSTPKHIPAKKLDTPKEIVEAAIEQGEPP